jgi:DNA-binding NtrC family response regulator
VVEDDTHVRRVARRILERVGFEVWDVGDAESAMEILEEKADHYDLVLTDLVLPGMGGRELVDWVRDRFPGLRLVVMSGYAEGSPGKRKDLPEEVAFIQKPFSPDGLVDSIREQLAGPEGREEGGR